MRTIRLYRRQEQETERKDRGAAHYLQEPGTVSLCHAAIGLGAGLGQGAGLVLPLHWHPHIHHQRFHHCSEVAHSIPFQPSAVEQLRGLGNFICPCSVVLIDTIELTQCGGGVRAGQQWEQSQIVHVFCCGRLRPPQPSLDYHPELRRFLPVSV